MNRIEAASQGYNEMAGGSIYVIIGIVIVIAIFAVGHMVRERQIQKKIAERRRKLKKNR